MECPGSFNVPITTRLATSTLTRSPENSTRRNEVPGRPLKSQVVDAAAGHEKRIDELHRLCVAEVQPMGALRNHKAHTSHPGCSRL